MVPLGILTVITGAIRVQGPRIVKSFIGRGRENRALAKIQLMSSTSKEVCELFNGKSIIRVIGKPKLAQLLVFPEEYEQLEYAYENEDNGFPDPIFPASTDHSCGIHSLQTAVSTGVEGYPLMRRERAFSVLLCLISTLTEDTAYHSYSYISILRLVQWIPGRFCTWFKFNQSKSRQHV